MSPLAVSLTTASAATAICCVFGIPLAHRLARPAASNRLLEFLVHLPLVLPPTVVGWMLVLLLGRGSGFGRWLVDDLGVRLLFSWPALTMASAVLAMPLFVRSAAAGLAAVDDDLRDSARIAGAGDWQLWWHVVRPLAWHGIAGGAALAFGRSLGEFGAALMVGGQIPGKTESLAIALWSAMETGDTAGAARSAWLLGLCGGLVNLGVVATGNGMGWPTRRGFVAK
ncbi:MAG: molybdate ABC transporter permease subunit [Armatimonadota bacterium]